MLMFSNRRCADHGCLPKGKHITTSSNTAVHTGLGSFFMNLCMPFLYTFYGKVPEEKNDARASGLHPPPAKLSPPAVPANLAPPVTPTEVGAFLRTHFRTHFLCICYGLRRVNFLGGIEQS